MTSQESAKLGVTKDGLDVAVKKLKPCLDDLHNKQFQNEFDTLRKLDHQNIVKILGYCYETKQRLFIMPDGSRVFVDDIHTVLCLEYLHNGSLQKHLSDESCKVKLDWHMRFKIIKGICEGLKYMHKDLEEPIYHLDIKPDNILLDKDMVPKIADFALSRIFSQDIIQTTADPYGTVGYQPPEYIDRGEISGKFDIFSLGVVIISIVSRPMSYPQCLHMPADEVIDQVRENWRNKLHEAWSSSDSLLEAYCRQVETCTQIALSCLNEDSQKRPDIVKIIETLSGIEIGVGKDKDDWVNSLDDLLHDVAAEPINIQLSVLQDITKNFANERKIGQGGFGIVYKGVLQTGCVAVKKLLNIQTIDDGLFCREATSLMGVRHKHIVRFLGYCANTDHEFIKKEGSESHKKLICSEIRERLLCFEYMSNGGLDSHLTDELRGLQWHTCYQIIKGICEGLQYLHKEKMIHMDLKPANILLDDYMVPKITDFGISRYLDGVSRHVTENCIVSLGYCAPEYLQGGEMSLKADIFSLGAIIRDIVSGRKQDIDSNNVLRRWRYRWNRSGKYPPLGYQQISKCIAISQSCMEENPKLRPYIWEIIIDPNEEENTNEHITNAVEYMDGQIGPYPWELLDIDPLELNFSFKPNMHIQSKIELNNQRDDYIAFNIQKPGILNYIVEPSKGIMQPHCRSSVTVTLQASNRMPDTMICKENFTVRCAIVDDGLTVANVNEDMFNTKLGKVVDEVMLTVAFM